MPTYDYRCPDGHEFEKFFRKISDSVTELPCPECGKPAIRLVSGGAVHFKGSGFYLTDYGKNAHRKGAPSSRGGEEKTKGESKAGESTSSASGDSTTGDAKPAESKPSEAKTTSESKATKKPSSSGNPKSGT
ncbi:MAG TPA: zinc ribbon domain-containing protein [Gemmatimonadaceae bacterium]|nr:zinc ribbon domain-containing protein [Gemmatimonadaceae bacterium]